MRLNLKYNGLAWHVENDSSDITNEMYVYNTDGSLSHVVSDSNYTDYDGDGTEIFEETTSGCTFYKYIGAISEQICAIPLENNVFKLIAANQYSAPTIFNADKSKLSLDVALSQSKTIGDMYANFQAGVDAVYNAVKAEGVTPSASTPTAIAAAIATIRNGGNATASQILSGYTAYSNKKLITGNLAVKSNTQTITHNYSSDTVWTQDITSYVGNATLVNIRNITNMSFFVMPNEIYKSNNHWYVYWMAADAANWSGNVTFNYI